MQISISPIYEPLTVNIGDKTVELVVDLTNDNLLAISEVCASCGQRFKAVEKIKNDAKGSRNYEGMKKANKEMAKLLKEAITQAIGEEGYNELLEACGNGRDVKPSACNNVMAIVFKTINQIVTKHNAEIVGDMVDPGSPEATQVAEKLMTAMAKIESVKEQLDDKAAHYLSEVANAQAQPDAAE